ncbi:hypothetical protein K0M31_004991 [Melipona bicolor]|uniref:Uncharacterized protein n=1 Tax=Melipona bicolor TaxID=60889 RepID=A0AA40KN38_9HYME|nr:hypothetical protein K0M31_004991 [Melipona bicolor]
MEGDKRRERNERNLAQSSPEGWYFSFKPSRIAEERGRGKNVCPHPGPPIRVNFYSW